MAEQESATTRPASVLVPDGVWVLAAQGNALAIETDQGVVLVDTGRGGKMTEGMIAELRTLTDAPVSAICYSHGHVGYNAGLPQWVDHNAAQAMDRRASSLTATCRPATPAIARPRVTRRSSTRCSPPGSVPCSTRSRSIRPRRSTTTWSCPNPAGRAALDSVGDRRRNLGLAPRDPNSVHRSGGAGRLHPQRRHPTAFPASHQPMGRHPRATD